MFKPGEKRPENAGRKKGTPNKRTQLLKPILDEMGYDPVKELLNTLSLMDEYKEVAKIQMKLIEMCYAKPSTVNITSEDKSAVVLKLAYNLEDDINTDSN